MAASITLTNAALLDLTTGFAGEPTQVHVVEGRLSRTAAPGAPQLDLGGALVMPGLWDAHVHMAQWAQVSRWVNVVDSSSPAEAAERLGAAPGDDPILVGFGFRDSRWAEVPTAAMLDATTGDRPTVVLSGDVHSAWLNTAALAHFGLGGDGLLREEDAFAVQQQLNLVDEDQLDGWIRQAAAVAASLGVVGIVDLSHGWNARAWQRRVAAGLTSLRVRCGFYAPELDRVIDSGLSSGQALDASGLVTVGPLKVISDGSLTARTARCHQPYLETTLGPPVPGHPDGVTNVEAEELVALLSRGAGQGLECAVHAIGDRAVSDALIAFEVSGAGGSLEHAQLVRRDDIARMARLGIRASVQPAHLIDDRDAADQLWADRTERMLPLASLLAAGVEVALGSDAPVSPLDPWLAIEVAVRRTSGDRPPWHPEQQLSVSQALLSSTRGVKELVVGAEADLIVLDANPFEVDPAQLHAIRPRMTMVAGRLTHQSEVGGE